MSRLYVARKKGKTPNIPWRFSSYTETVDSKPVEIDGKFYPIIFLKNEVSLHGSLYDGWEDCTDLFYAEQAKKEEEKRMSMSKTTSRSKISTSTKILPRKKGRPKTKKGG